MPRLQNQKQIHQISIIFLTNHQILMVGISIPKIEVNIWKSEQDLKGSFYFAQIKERMTHMPEVVVAICSLIGTLVGSLAGIMTANKLTIYRIEQLEEKVKKHNNLVERMIAVEQSTKSAHHRLDELLVEVREEH